MISRIGMMAMIAAIALIGVAGYNQAITDLDSAAESAEVYGIVTAVGEPGLQLIPLVLFALLVGAAYTALRRLAA